MKLRVLLPAALPLALAACATTGTKSPSAHVGHAPAPAPTTAAAPHKPKTSPYAPAQEDLSKRGDYVAGGLFRPGVPDSVPSDIPDVDAIPEPDVRDEPRAKTGNRDYTVLGKKYRVLDDHEGYVEEGMASYYGNKFHGRRTSSQEVYDMYAFTGAHKTLPLPSFARVTNLENGKTIVVRINDRGPFHPGRVIDLSYSAAVKLGYREKGSARVRVEALQPEDGEQVAAAKPAATKTSMDQLVAKLPAAPRVTTADGFDAWMQSQQIRIATGKPKTASNETVAAPAVAAESSQPAAGRVTLQVASFSNQENAEHALSRLRGAAIANAQLQDKELGGRKVWRLRIGPVDESVSAELAARVVGLGFGPPQRVHD